MDAKLQSNEQCAKCRFSAMCLPIGIGEFSTRMLICMECGDAYWNDSGELVLPPLRCDALAGLLFARGADDWRCEPCGLLEMRRRRGW